MIKDAAILIPAAGASRRFNGCKLLARYNGCTLLKRIVLEAESVRPGHVYVILGAHRALLEHEASPANIIVNPNWHSGMGGSISIAVSKLSRSYNAVLIVLADQVAIQTKHLRALLDVHKTQKANLVCSRFNDILGPPALFAKDNLDLLKSLKGDKGAGTLLKEAGPVVIDLPAAGIDIDTRSQLTSYTIQ